MTCRSDLILPLNPTDAATLATAIGTDIADASVTMTQRA